MNIDERIEALTQSVELIAAMHQDLEKKWEGRMEKMLQIMESLSAMTQRMGQIIEKHEERIDGHDQRLDKLEH